MSFDDVETYEDLIHFLKDWINFGGDEPPYDYVGIAHLFFACLDNISRNFSEAELAELGYFPDPEQVAFLELLVDGMRQTPED